MHTYHSQNPPVLRPTNSIQTDLPLEKPAPVLSREITLAEILDAREARAAAQRRLAAGFGLPLVSFCMNIAGPIKTSPLIERAFSEGKARLEAALAAARIKVLAKQEIHPPTGPEALYAADGDPGALKALCVKLEDADTLGRLFDLDVLDKDCRKLSRRDLGHAERPCLICGKVGPLCARSRTHTAEELQKRAQKIMGDFFAAEDAGRIAACAARALLYEVCAAPKPGLVDRLDRGSHKDMDLFTYLDSTCALIPYFRDAVALGQKTAAEAPEHTFELLRPLGIRAEQCMYEATGGVNTHKGIIFSLGIMCAATGRLWHGDGRAASPDALSKACQSMCVQAMEKDFAEATGQGSYGPETAGLRLHAELGIRGVRGEAAAGFPSVFSIGLPALRQGLLQGLCLEKSLIYALLCLMATVTDTNILHRSDEKTAAWVQARASELISSGASDSGVVDSKALGEFVQQVQNKNLSPGGCADLLALSSFLLFYFGDIAL